MKLTYFDVRGRAEVARMLFALAEVPYEDCRIDGEQWMKMKKDTPFGQLPMLEGDGAVLCQSRTIGRYLANKFGFAGSSALEKGRGDMIVDCCEDIGQSAAKAFFIEDEKAKAEAVQTFTETELPDYLEKMEKMLKNHRDGNTFFVRDTITWSDLSVYTLIEWLQSMGVKMPFSKSPKLEGLLKRVEKHPKVAKWIKDRPVTKI